MIFVSTRAHENTVSVTFFFKIVLARTWNEVIGGHMIFWFSREKSGSRMMLLCLVLAWTRNTLNVLMLAGSTTHESTFSVTGLHRFELIGSGPRYKIISIYMFFRLALKKC